MRIDLGEIIRALENWTICINEDSPSCVFIIELPEWARNLSKDEQIYLALYLAAKYALDYRLAAAMHIFMIKNKIALRPELLIKALREARVVSRAPRTIEDDSPYAWEATLYKGILYAQAIMEAEKKKN